MAHRWCIVVFWVVFSEQERGHQKREMKRKKGSFKGYCGGFSQCEIHEREKEMVSRSIGVRKRRLEGFSCEFLPVDKMKAAVVMLERGEMKLKLRNLGIE